MLGLIAIALPAQTLTPLHSFQNTDGANPFAGLLYAGGNFYGTTYSGGASLSGTVFGMTPSGTLPVVYSFCSQTNCTDGALPVGSLIHATNGNLYGTTGYGGANNRGTVFEFTPTGTLTVLYSFCNLAGCTDGALPYAGLLQGADGNLYGTTKFGGTNSWGTVFSISTGGTFTTLYSFCPQSGCADGARPNSALIQGIDLQLYGTTVEGGVNGDNGTVFKITTGGALTTLYSFCAQAGCTDGASPVAPLVQASNGLLYGTTQFGGANNNNGTVFQITPFGALTTLYNFCAQTGCPDGQGPTGGLLQATDGNLYGTTNAGGAGYGTIYKTSTSGSLATVYAFPGPGQGQGPYAGLIQAPNGEFYGTTFIGGASGYGEVFSLTVQVAVPNVVGLSQAAATTAISGAGLVVGTVTTATSGSVPAGSVISQSPVSGIQANMGSAVNLVVSSGPGQVAVPNVVGLSQTAATTAITNAGLVVGTVTMAASATISAGNVISENPGAGTQVSPGSAVNLAISTDTLISPSQISTVASGLTFSRVTQTFNGTVTIKNISSSTISGPLQMVATSLTSGVTMVNQASTFNGMPYLMVSAGALAPGQSATVSVQFKDPSNATIHFTPAIYFGSLN